MDAGLQAETGKLSKCDGFRVLPGLRESSTPSSFRSLTVQSGLGHSNSEQDLGSLVAELALEVESADMEQPNVFHSPGHQRLQEGFCFMEDALSNRSRSLQDPLDMDCDSLCDHDSILQEWDTPPPAMVPSGAAYVNRDDATNIMPGCVVLRSHLLEDGMRETKPPSHRLSDSIPRIQPASVEHITENLEGILGKSQSTESLVKSLSEQLPHSPAASSARSVPSRGLRKQSFTRLQFPSSEHQHELANGPNSQSVGSMASASQVALQMASEIDRRMLERDDSIASLTRSGSQPWGAMNWLKAIRVHQRVGHLSRGPSVTDLHQAMSHSSSVASLLSVLSEPEAKLLLAASQSTGCMQGGMLQSTSSRSLLSVVSEEDFIKPTVTKPTENSLATSPSTGSASGKELQQSNSQSSECMHKVTWIVEQVIDFGIPAQVEDKFFDRDSVFWGWRLPSLSYLTQPVRLQRFPEMLCYSKQEGHDDRAEERDSSALVMRSPTAAEHLKPAPAASAGGSWQATPHHAQTQSTTQWSFEELKELQAAVPSTAASSTSRAPEVVQSSQVPSWTQYVPNQLSSRLPWMQEMWSKVMPQ
mmetsp:Transcript_44618/g.105792  ORF Transcript_44618/g.105792 Transcript_44618/m.105792 type:complete len:588 (-) Transcript_44618:221-1984(-)